MPTNPHKNRTGIDRLWHAVIHSFDGFVSAYRNESAFRQELWFAVIALPASMWLGQNWLERAVLGASIVLVLIVELLNSAVEAAIDRIGYEQHELSKLAKDFGSAAVFLSLTLCCTLLLCAGLRSLWA